MLVHLNSDATDLASLLGMTQEEVDTKTQPVQALYEDLIRTMCGEDFDNKVVGTPDLFKRLNEMEPISILIAAAIGMQQNASTDMENKIRNEMMRAMMGELGNDTTEDVSHEDVTEEKEVPVIQLNPEPSQSNA